MKVTRKIIEIDDERCDGCGQCILGCAEGALKIVDGKARVISDTFCDGLGACIGECPTGALKLIEREAEEFDEAAVEAHLAQNSDDAGTPEPAMPCGCPSSQIQTFIPAETSGTGEPAGHVEPESALSHWPIQIRLVPPNAPFLKGAELLVLADCSAVAFADLHRSLLKGKVVMMGCPKFDDAQGYVQKFADIFQTAGIRHITVAYMEVPCCGGMPMIVKKALEVAKRVIPVEEIMISTLGKRLEKDKVA
jgi:NAD-dependent dihydropyrimidine dehydrogenase PreA subunit